MFYFGVLLEYHYFFNFLTLFLNIFFLPYSMEFYSIKITRSPSSEKRCFHTSQRLW